MTPPSSIFAQLRQLFRNRELRFFPILGVFPGYGRSHLVGDVRAGFNVALLAFPQGMAYAAIAGLPIAYGLYGTIIASIVAPIFAGSRFIASGPTNATGVLIFGALMGMGLVTEAERVALLPLMMLLVGILLVVGAILRVAALVQYVSRSVIAGYITAAALYIILNQFKNVLGFDFALPANSTFLDAAFHTLRGLTETHFPTAAVSVLTVAIYFACKRYAPRLPTVGVTLLAASLLTALLHWLTPQWGWAGVETLSAVRAGDWSWKMPAISPENIRIVSNAALVLAFICILEGCSIGKSIAARAGEKIALNQEILGLGMANTIGSFLQGMPASGSLTRSQLNFNSGARTALATVFCGLLCLATLLLAGRFISYIPVAVLGVLVIAIGFSLINRHVIRVVWKATKGDRLVFAVTFAAALLTSLDFAIMLGVAISILLFLRKAAQPELVEYTQDAEGGFKPLLADEKESVPEVSIVHVEGDLFFGASEIFRDQMRRACAKPNLQVVILKMRNAHHLDATSVLALEDLVRSLQSSGRALLVSEAREEARTIFEDSGLLKILGEENFFPDDASNRTLSTSRAIRRAMKLLNGKDAEVKIFLGASKKSDDPEDATKD